MVLSYFVFDMHQTRKEVTYACQYMSQSFFSIEDCHNIWSSAVYYTWSNSSLSPRYFMLLSTCNRWDQRIKCIAQQPSRGYPHGQSSNWHASRAAPKLFNHPDWSAPSLLCHIPQKAPSSKSCQQKVLGAEIATNEFLSMCLGLERNKYSCIPLEPGYMLHLS